jgi:tetratricopeptide (TPR) repeat protein
VRDDVFVSLLMQAWNGQLELLQLIDQCSKLEQEQRAPLAAILYQTWLKRTPSTHAHAAYFNLGATLSNLGDLAASEEAYRQAIALSPGFIQPRLNLGLVLERRGLLDQAVEEWRWVERNVPADTDEYQAFLLLALNNLGRVLEIKKEYRDATDYLDRSLSIDPTQADVLHHWVFLRMKQCCWPVYRTHRQGQPGTDGEFHLRPGHARDDRRSCGTTGRLATLRGQEGTQGSALPRQAMAATDTGKSASAIAPRISACIRSRC